MKHLNEFLNKFDKNMKREIFLKVLALYYEDPLGSSIKNNFNSWIKSDRDKNNRNDRTNCKSWLEHATIEDLQKTIKTLVNREKVST